MRPPNAATDRDSSKRINAGPSTRSCTTTLSHAIASTAGWSCAREYTNLTDKDPPFVNNWTGANTDAATYRLLGRTYFAQLRWRLR